MAVAARDTEAERSAGARRALCASSDLPEGGLLRVEVEVDVGAGSEPVLLARVDGEVHAVSDTCTHERTSLSEGFLEGRCVECPLHGAMFDLRDGRAVTLPATAPLPVFAVTERDGFIWLQGSES